jgi:flagellar biosynthesis protein
MTEDSSAIKKAVALRYDRGEHDAPVVAASGRGQTAEKILEIAKQAGVAIQQDPDLVEILAKVPVGDEIPVELYQAVAEILAFVYGLNKKQ